MTDSPADSSDTAIPPPKPDEQRPAATPGPNFLKAIAVPTTSSASSCVRA